MRLNKYLAQATQLSRRAADQAISQHRVQVDGQLATLGQDVPANAIVSLDNQPLQLHQHQTIMLHKPVGYICSRRGQGSHTIYDLLPKNLHHLNPIGRLDKDSSGLLLLTNNGDLANQLAHPRYVKTKVYLMQLDRPLTATDRTTIQQGVKLADGISRLDITNTTNPYRVSLHEGRNRQIRRTLATLGYKVTKLHRISFGPYQLGTLPVGQHHLITSN